MVTDSLIYTSKDQQGKIQIHEELSKFLDSLRGVSAIIIFLSHFIQIYLIPLIGTETYFWCFSEIFASYAVMSFFVLSGFVITTSILKNIERNSKFDVKQYFVSRIARIYPPFLFSLLLSILVYFIITSFNLHGATTFRLPGDLYVAREKIIIDIGRYVKNLFMLPGFVGKWKSISINGPLWAITYEFWIYIMAMFFVLWFKNKKLIKGAVPFLAINYFLCLTTNTMFFFITSIWIIGAVGALIYHKKIKAKNIVVYPILIFVFFVLIQAVAKGESVLFPYIGYREYRFQFLAVAFLAALMWFQKIRNLLNHKFFREISRYSYTLYVSQFPILLLSFSFLHQYFVKYGVLFRSMVFVLLAVIIFGFSSWISKYTENKKFFLEKITMIANYVALKSIWKSGLEK